MKNILNIIEEDTKYPWRDEKGKEVNIEELLFGKKKSSKLTENIIYSICAIILLYFIFGALQSYFGTINYTL